MQPRRSYVGDSPFPLWFRAHATMLTIALITRFYQQWDNQKDKMSMLFETGESTYDFIVVGAGSSGSSLASRLSTKYSVLLLDAGYVPSFPHSMPYAAYSLWKDPSVDWSYKTEPQKHACFGLNNNVMHWPAGKVLGGSSMINAMMYFRGNVQGFDQIAEKTGNSIWRTSNILKYYKNMENYNGWFSNDSHGQNGTLNIERSRVSDFIDNMMDAGRELGYRVRDPNGFESHTEGFAKMDSYVHNCKRWGAYEQFLLPANNGGNLTIKKFSIVTKLLFKEKTNLEILGVEYIRHGKIFKVKAKYETILSAGTIKTPQILMLSGIGPKEELLRLRINVRLDLPVGKHLQDKYGVIVGPFVVPPYRTQLLPRDLTLRNLFTWATLQKGPLCSSWSEGAWSIISESAKKRGRTRYPDIDSYIMSTSISEVFQNTYVKALNLKPEVIKHFSKVEQEDSFLQIVTLNSPLSSGVLTLPDKNPLSNPVINPRYLENDIDVDILLEGLKFAIKLVENTTAMSKIRGRFMHVRLPGCESFIFGSDEYFKCVIRHATASAFKFAGTAPIGKDVSDPVAVVDSHLRVLGTKRLRVVDASVLQLKHVSANDVTCRMLGQFAADIIFNDWHQDIQVT